MLKKDLVDRVSEKTEFLKKDVSEIIDATIESILEGLGEDGIVKLSPTLGTFKIVDRAARKAHNPQTGEIIEVPASHAVKFTPAKPVKEMFRD